MVISVSEVGYDYGNFPEHNDNAANWQSQEMNMNFVHQNGSTMYNVSSVPHAMNSPNPVMGAESLKRGAEYMENLPAEAKRFAVHPPVADYPTNQMACKSPASPFFENVNGSIGSPVDPSYKFANLAAAESPYNGYPGENAAQMMPTGGMIPQEIQSAPSPYPVHVVQSTTPNGIPLPRPPSAVIGHQDSPHMAPPTVLNPQFSNQFSPSSNFVQSSPGLVESGAFSGASFNFPPEHHEMLNHRADSYSVDCRPEFAGSPSFEQSFPNSYGAQPTLPSSLPPSSTSMLSSYPPHFPPDQPPMPMGLMAPHPNMPPYRYPMPPHGPPPYPYHPLFHSPVRFSPGATPIPPFFRDERFNKLPGGRKSPLYVNQPPPEAVKLGDVCDMKEPEDLAKLVISDPDKVVPESGDRELAEKVLTLESKLCFSLLNLTLPDPVVYIYNPLDYAKQIHQSFVLRWGCTPKKVLFLGMNPGPFGMAQNGIPFGDSQFVKNFLRIESGVVGKPAREHPKRPVWGLDCPQREVSGSRFWSLIQSISGTPEAFFEHCYVYNYCPLVFLGMSGKNITPPSLTSAAREPLLQACDKALIDVISTLKIEKIVAVGRFVEERSKLILKSAGREEIDVIFIMHPSPINPKANAGWESIVKNQLEEAKISHYFPHFTNPIQVSFTSVSDSLGSSKTSPNASTSTTTPNSSHGTTSSSTTLSDSQPKKEPHNPHEEESKLPKHSPPATISGLEKAPAPICSSELPKSSNSDFHPILSIASEASTFADEFIKAEVTVTENKAYCPQPIVKSNNTHNENPNMDKIPEAYSTNGNDLISNKTQVITQNPSVAQNGFYPGSFLPMSHYNVPGQVGAYNQNFYNSHPGYDNHNQLAPEPFPRLSSNFPSADVFPPNGHPPPPQPTYLSGPNPDNFGTDNLSALSSFVHAPSPGPSMGQGVPPGPGAMANPHDCYPTPIPAAAPTSTLHHSFFSG